MKFILLSITYLILTSCVHAQTSPNATTDVAFEFQWYPAGTITGLTGSYNFSENHAIQLRVAYNNANRHDFGKHDDEKGGGVGFTVGYRYYFKAGHEKWFAGLRSDLWNLKINWQENDIMGSTRILVLQPTLEVGYLFRISDHFFISPSIANGFEINVRTKGEPVGEGLISLIGLQAGWRF
jgi:Protein of unknown function (DUF3575)